MTKPTVLHLIDDTTAGGVTRVIDHIITSPELARDASHRVLVVDGKQTGLHHPEAHIIVSHLSVNWRNLPRFVVLKRRNPQARLIHVEHSYTEAFMHLNVRNKTRFRLLLRLAYGLFDKVAAVSHAQGVWLSRIGAVRRQRLTTIRSFVDLSAFAALAPAAGPIRVIGAIGRLEPQKGFDDLIRAFRTTDRPDLELHIYGTGAQETALMALAQGDPRITFKGFAKDPVAAMKQVDAVAMPSRWEAYGLVAIEALAAGRTLFVNAVDGLQDHKVFGAVEVSDTRPDAWRALFEKIAGTPDCAKGGKVLDALKAEFLQAWRTEVLQG